jgi:hypothetical protein
MAEYDKRFMNDMDLPSMASYSDFEGGEADNADNANDIQTVALGKDQIRKTTRVETVDSFHTTVEILEPDPGAGMASTGLRTVRKEIVARGKRA